MCRDVEEVTIPDGYQPHQQGNICLGWRDSEVLIHRVESGKQVGESLRTDGHHGAQSNSGVHGVAPTHPVPKPEHVDRVDTKRGHPISVGGDGHEVTGHGCLTKSLHQPVPGGTGIRQCLLSAKCFGRHDKKRFCRIKVTQGFRDVAGIDVGDKSEAHGSVAIKAQGVVRHCRAEI